MSSSQPSADSVLPEGARLLYVGPMKTGTTAIQAAARDQRRNLLDHGVRYPGTGLNHRSAFGALMGWSTAQRDRTGPLDSGLDDAERGGVPDAGHWDDLKAEIESETSRRVLVTHEFVSQADDATCARIVDELGQDRIHVAITLRSPAAILPSLWAQNIKGAAETDTFHSWLSRLYDTNSDRPVPGRVLLAYDQGELVRRWSRLVGPDNVTVIVIDRDRPRLLSDTFETLLGLPAGMLSRGTDTNRAFTAVEAGLFRQLNKALYEHGVDWRAFNDLVRHGAVGKGLLNRPLPDDEPRLRLPGWASEAAQLDGKRFAEHIRDSGVRVVGDLETLGTAPPAGAEHVEADTVPTDIGVHALTGAVIAGQKAQRGADKRERQRDAAHAHTRRLKNELASVRKELDREKNRTLYDRTRALPPDVRTDHTAAAYTTRELLAAVKRRLTHKLRTGKSHPLKPLPREK